MSTGWKNPQTQPPVRSGRGASLARKWVQQRHLQTMALLGVVWMIIFHYIPMYGILIAFKHFDIIGTLSSAPWAGLEHFRAFLEDDNFWYIVKNTLGISLLKLAIGFPLPIVFALFLNEIRSTRFKKSIQTISYLPHFLSWVILGGILTTWLADTGMINQLLLAWGWIDQPISYLAEPSYFGLSSLARISGRSLDGQLLSIWQQWRGYLRTCMKRPPLTEPDGFRKCGTSPFPLSRGQYLFYLFWRLAAY